MCRSAGISLQFARAFLALVFAGFVGCGAIAAGAEQVPEATLTLLNREIVTLRASLAGATPAVRVQRALQRIAEIPPSEYDQPLRALPFSLGEARGMQILLGDRILFSLLENDIDPEVRDSVASLTQRTLSRLEEARRAWHATQDRTLLLRGAAIAVAISLVLLATGWGVLRGGRFLSVRLEHWRRARARVSSQADFREFAARFAAKGVHLVQLVLCIVLIYLWLRLVLGSFVITEPIAHRLRDWLLTKAAWLLEGFTDALPSLVTVLIVVIVTRLIADVLGTLFDAVQHGRLRVTLVHPETMTATRRIVTLLVWALGIAIAYPYLPGASSDAFKGLSVLLGLMITLGSTSIMTQAMSGLVVIYARALRRGDFVEIGGIQGVVTEVAVFATKILNLRNEEITIPNAVLVSSPIHNFSRLANSQGTLLSARVGIGYDASWRQVHALLEQAARATPGLRADPPPKVYQRALSDFYVEYELLVGTDHPLERLETLSQLHANIQDAFREAGIEVLSPHYIDRPGRTTLKRENA